MGGLGCFASLRSRRTGGLGGRGPGAISPGRAAPPLRCRSGGSLRRWERQAGEGRRGAKGWGARWSRTFKKSSCAQLQCI